MKKLSQKDKEKLIPKKTEGGNSPIRQQAFNLEVGEMIFIPKKEWQSYKYSPKTTIASLLHSKKKKFSSKQYILDKTEGYTITRIK